MKHCMVVYYALLMLFVVPAMFAQQNKAVTAGEPLTVELTIYNADFALIREERIMNLAKGFNTVVVPDIPATIDGTSLHLSSLTEPSAVRVRNHKNEAVEVLVYEHPWRWNQWEIVKTTVEYEKVDQSTIKFPVKLKKDEEKVMTYTIRYSW